MEKERKRTEHAVGVADDVCPKPDDKALDSDCQFQANSTSDAALVVLPDTTSGQSRHFIRFADRQWWINYHWHNPGNSWDHDAGKGTYEWGNGWFNSDFDPKNFFTQDQDGPVTLRAFKKPDGSGVVTSEIVLADILGYGSYLVTAHADTGSFGSLDEAAVFGIFTYQYSLAPKGGCINRQRELDALETISSKYAYKNHNNDGHNAQFTIQPVDADPSPELIHRFTIPDPCPYITTLMTWKAPPEGGFPVVLFAAYNGDFTYEQLKTGNYDVMPYLLQKWQMVDPNNAPKYVPLHTGQSCERLHINLYLAKGTPPTEEQRVTLTRFQYIPDQP